jgi:hypothetical protein
MKMNSKIKSVGVVLINKVNIMIFIIKIKFINNNNNFTIKVYGGVIFYFLDLNM